MPERPVCLTVAYQGFVFTSNGKIHLSWPSEKLRLKVNTKPWIHFNTILLIFRQDKLLKKYSKCDLQAHKVVLWSTKIAVQKTDQSAFVCSKSKKQTPEQCVKSAHN